MPNTSQPRLLSFTLDKWNALGGEVSISLADKVAVLVGRNGAGKSAILEGFHAISSWASGKLTRFRQFNSNSIPQILDIEILTPTERVLKYRYELVFLPAATDAPDIDGSDVDDSTSDGSEENQYSWNERCEYIDRDELLWITETGVTKFNNNGDPIIAILGNTSSLRQLHIADSQRLSLNIPIEMQWVYSVLRGVRVLGKTPARQTVRRYPSIIKVSRKGMSSNAYGLADMLTRKILRLISAGELKEFESVCQRIGLGSKITVQKFLLNEDSREKIKDKDEDEGYVSSVLVDGVNIGLLSDGTLRVLSILIEVVASYPSSTTIIEEPESQIHPGMLDKLLNEIQTYTFEGNLILSTHSPQVVGWTSPNEINLVFRNDGRTIVRKLNEKEIHSVTEYLYEEGDLGEWLYSGIIDE